MNMQQIDNSSNVKAIGYDPESKTLRVEFLSGGTYDYAGVPQSEFNALESAGSVGGYLAKNIKGKFPSQKVG